MSRQGARLLQTCCGISHRCKLPHRSSAALPPQAKPVPQRPRTAVAARTLSSFSAFNGTTSSRTGFRTSSRGAPSTCVRSVSTSSTVEDDGHLQQYKDRLRHLGPGRVHLSLDDNTGLATLVLDNHERRNALSGKMMVELSAAVKTLEAWERGVALIVEGAGGNFCAGADLSLAREHLVTGSDGRLMCSLMTDTLTRLGRLPLVSVAVLDGAAIGGGAELSTCCDFRVAGPEAVIRFVQVKMGVSTGWGGGARLVGILGRRAALRLLAWSLPVSATEGQALGLVDAVAAKEGGARAEAEIFLDGVLKRDAYGAVRAVKSVVAAADTIPQECRTTEEDHFSALWGGPHNRVALGPKKTP